LKEEVLDRTVWRNCVGGSFGTVVKQTTKWMSLPNYANYDMKEYGNIAMNYSLK
jgi:hypothetical protein